MFSISVFKELSCYHCQHNNSRLNVKTCNPFGTPNSEAGADGPEVQKDWLFNANATASKMARRMKYLGLNAASQFLRIAGQSKR